MTQQGKDINCELCKLEIDNQEHLLNCQVLKNIVPELNKTSVRYEDIFGEVEKIIPAGKLFEKISKAREEVLKIISNND